MSSYRVVIEGGTLPGFSPNDVRPRLGALVKQSDEAAGKLLSGQPTVVKSGVDQATGMRYVNALTQIGVACRVELETLDIETPEPEASSVETGHAGVDPMEQKVAEMPLEHPLKKLGEKFCTECGAVIMAQADICPKCGVRQITLASTSHQSGKKPTALVKIFKLFLYVMGGLMLIGILGIVFERMKKPVAPRNTSSSTTPGARGMALPNLVAANAPAIDETPA